MGTCVCISPDKKNILVDYYPEPILAEASAQIMRDAETYSTLLDKLQKHISMGFMGKL